MRLLSLVGLLTLALSCTKPHPEQTSTLRTAVGNRVTNFYLKDSLQKNVWNYNLLFAQSLFVRADDGKLVPDLGITLREISPLNFEVPLLPDAVFHNGQPVRCADVLWSYNDANNPDSHYAATFAQVAAWGCAGEVFQIHLKQPIHALLERILVGIRIYPTGSFPAASGAPIGSGPYRFDAQNEVRSVWLRHEKYRGAFRPQTTRLEFYHVPDARTRLEWLKIGKLDTLLEWPSEMDPLLKALPSELKIQSYPGTVVTALGFSRRSPCFRQPAARAMVAAFVAGQTEWRTNFLPSKVFPPFAKSEGQSAPTKLPCGPVTFHYHAQSPLAFYAAPLIQNLNKHLGIHSQIQESSVFFSKLNAGALDFFAVTLPADEDPAQLYEYLHSSQLPPQKNRFYLKNSTVDALVEELRLTRAPQQIASLVGKLGQQLQTEVPFIPLGIASGKMVAHRNVEFQKSVSLHPWLLMLEAVKKNP